MKRPPVRPNVAERGAVAAEYALVVGLVSVLVVAGTIALSDTVGDFCATLVVAMGGMLGI